MSHHLRGVRSHWSTTRVVGVCADITGTPHRRLRAADPTVTLAERYWRLCHDQRKAWQGQPDDDGRSDLWLARAMGLSAFIEWVRR